MAEYYPLLVRAVAALPNSTPEARRKMYDRARQALIGQLRKIDPPVPESDIERESRALDDAVVKLEAELNGKASMGTAVASSAVAAAPGPSRPAEVPVPPSPQTPSPPRRPFVASRPPSNLSPNGPQGAPQRRTATTPPPVPPVKREPEQVSRLPPRVQAPEPKPMPEGSAAKVDSRLAGELPFRDDSDVDQLPKRTKPNWRGFARPRFGGAENPENGARENGARDNERAATGAGPAAELPKPLRGRGEAVRPRAPQPERPRRGLSRHWIVGSIVAIVVVAIAGMAILLKDNPSELARRAHLAAQSPEAAQQAPRKIDARVGGTPAQQTAPSAAPPASQTQQPAPAQQPNGAIPVAQRAALLVEVPNTPQKVKTYVGTVVWRSVNVNHGQDQPVSVAVEADIDIPDAKLKATMVFQKNTDATLPASHTIEIRFMPAPGSPIPGIKQIDVPQMREENTPTGESLTGVPAPITENYFLVGLTQGDAAVAHNLDLIRTRQWFDIPLQLTDNRIAKITFEKGDPGDRAIKDALAAWQ